MERRDFFKAMVGGVAVAAAVRTWPFRVYSFPSEPILAPTYECSYIENPFQYFAKRKEGD